MFLSSKSASTGNRLQISYRRILFPPPPPSWLFGGGEGMGQGGGGFADDCRGDFSPRALKDDRNIRVGFV